MVFVAWHVNNGKNGTRDGKKWYNITPLVCVVIDKVRCKRCNILGKQRYYPGKKKNLYFTDFYCNKANGK